jgi:signal transduction histidine kinase
MQESRIVLVVAPAASALDPGRALLGGAVAVDPGRPCTSEIHAARHELFVTGGAEEAAELLLRLHGVRRRAAVALFDLGPEVAETGLEAVRRVRAVDDQVLCLALAAPGDEVLTRVGQLFAGAPGDWDFLAVPFTADELRHRVYCMAAAWLVRREAELLPPTHDLLMNQGWWAALGALAAGLSHELNNPVAYIQSNFGSLSRHVEKITRYAHRVADGEAMLRRDDPEAAEAFFSGLHRLRKELKLEFVLDDIGELVEQSRRGMSRLQRIVSDLRSFSLPQDEPNQLDLNETIESVLVLVNNEIKYKATVERELAELPLIQSRRAELGRALLLVLLNAARAVGEGGTIWVETARPDPGQVRVEITDDGRPLQQELISRALGAVFHAGGEERARAFRLHQAYVIVRTLGGQVLAESSADGTTVTVNFPVEG